MIPIGGAEYGKAVGQELTRATEELKALHDGDVRYLAWLQEANGPQYLKLTEMSDAVRRAMGILPLESIQALLDVYISIHRFYFVCWQCKAQIGIEFLSRLVGSAASPWKM
jgi:hypothetical protein